MLVIAEATDVKRVREKRQFRVLEQKQKKHCCAGLNLMYSTSSLVAWLLFEFESELSLSHHPSTRFETTFRISDHLAEKTPFAALIEKQPADCIRLSDYLFNSEVSNRTCVFQRSGVFALIVAVVSKKPLSASALCES